MNKFDNDQVNHSPATMKQDGNGTLLQLRQAHLRRGGNHLTNGVRHGVRMNSDFSFYPSVKVFRIQAMAIHLVSDGRCKHYTKPTRTSHSRTRDSFSWLKTRVIDTTGIVVSHKTVVLTHSTACRTRPRCCCFFHT